MADACKEQMATPPAPVSELITAICNGQFDHVVQLLDSRVATEDASLAGYSAVHYAAVNNRAEILRILTQRGFKVNSRDSLGYTPLHLASAQGHLSAVTVLLEASCLINSQDHVHGNTAVHEAAWNGFSQTLQTLIQHKADVNLTNKAGFSPLHLSSQNGHNECSRILLFADCKPNSKNNYGDTPLHTAARYGHAGVTRILLIAKCNINEQNQNGDTVLHIAAALKFQKITKMLLQAGCDTNIKNNQNERAVDIAKRKGHDEIHRLLTSNVSIPSQQSESFDLSLYKISVPTVAAVTTETLTEKPTAKEKKQKWSLFSKNKKTKEKVQPESAKPAGNPAVLRSPNPQRQAQLQTLTTRPCLGPGQTVSVDPEVVLRSFHLHQMQKHHALKQGTSADPVRSFGDPTYPVQGMLSQYAIQGGVQYYRDLAGNIKQGPVGYVPETKQLMTRSRREVPYQPPDVSLPHVPSRLPTGGPIQHQYDHLSYLRSRNAHLTSGVQQVGQHPYLYEQPGHSDRYRVDSINRRCYPQQNLAPETGMPVRMVRSRSDETISTASSCQHPSVRAERTRNVRGHDPVLKRHRSRTRPVIGHLLKENPEYFASGNPGPEQESFDRHHRLKKSQRNGQTPHLRKKEEKMTSTSSESGANTSQPLPPGKPLPSTDVAQSRIDATSNPDSGYGGSKACLEGVTTSLRQLALSNSSSFHSNEDLRCNGSENKLTSSTDNTSVVSSAPSGSVVSLCNSL